VNVAAMLLLAPVVVAAGVLVRPLVPPEADHFATAKDRVHAAVELPHVIDPHARGEDVCLRSLPPELPGMEFRPKWRVCEPWELEAKARRARAGDAAVPPRPRRE
jgi:hypothetical protein